MENTTMGVRPADPSISEVIDELERFIALMDETVQRAEKMLQPVLRRQLTSDGVPGLGGDSEESVVSGLNGRLARLTRAVLITRDQLSEVLDRIDL